VGDETAFSGAMLVKTTIQGLPGSKR